MYNRRCLTSRNTGIACYITDGVSGFICTAGEIFSLAFKMKWILENKDKLEKIGQNGRRLYEEEFSMKVFGDRLEKALTETEEKYTSLYL